MKINGAEDAGRGIRRPRMCDIVLVTQDGAEMPGVVNAIYQQDDGMTVSVAGLPAQGTVAPIPVVQYVNNVPQGSKLFWRWPE